MAASATWSKKGRSARPPQAVKIQGSDGLLRIRTGDYRIIYTAEDATRTVLIRREVYRR